MLPENADRDCFQGMRIAPAEQDVKYLGIMLPVALTDGKQMEGLLMGAIGKMNHWAKGADLGIVGKVIIANNAVSSTLWYAAPLSIPEKRAWREYKLAVRRYLWENDQMGETYPVSENGRYGAAGPAQASLRAPNTYNDVLDAPWKVITLSSMAQTLKVDPADVESIAASTTPTKTDKRHDVDKDFGGMKEVGLNTSAAATGRTRNHTGEGLEEGQDMEQAYMSMTQNGQVEGLEEGTKNDKDTYDKAEEGQRQAMGATLNCQEKGGGMEPKAQEAEETGWPRNEKGSENDADTQQTVDLEQAEMGEYTDLRLLVDLEQAKMGQTQMGASQTGPADVAFSQGHMTTSESRNCLEDVDSM
ncbi:hypothetical protein CBR_g3424 [Chara braunii]|uniref:Uncharacterized protein n=1 Tax=Chara braunii TaxID=69332 RepID=A0A388JQW6_CHABU|nr:hypothetical protein CBR_g3424 [Chara braunii]|eukprot:GBG60180.1 hypothetical protein CBR_g3424 [Chara braunii]